MATGRSNKLVGQTGEYLVAAELSRSQIQKLLAEMKKHKLICLVGKTSSARWYPESVTKPEE